MLYCLMTYSIISTEVMKSVFAVANSLTSEVPWSPHIHARKGVCILKQLQIIIPNYFLIKEESIFLNKQFSYI